MGVAPVTLQAIPMVICMALLAPAHPYFGLPNHGRSSPFAGGAASDEKASAGPSAFEQAV